jgi:cytoskeletal protein CcmA (bactofilin family)
MTLLAKVLNLRPKAVQDAGQVPLEEATGVYIHTSHRRQIEHDVIVPHPPQRTHMSTLQSKIASGMQFRGTVQQPGSLTVEGELLGDVNLEGEGATLELSEKARLQGDVLAAAVIIRGNMDANVKAEFVEIHESATTRGAIQYAKIAMHGGDNEINLKRITPAAQ